MIAKIASLVLALATSAALAHDPTMPNSYNWPVVRVHDGDSAEVEALWLPGELGTRISIRLFGVDAPETTWRASCEQEKVRGRESLAALARLIARPGVTVRIVDWDKYGGRILGDFVTPDGVSVTQLMLEQGHVQVYTGAGPKPNWCD